MSAKMIWTAAIVATWVGAELSWAPPRDLVSAVIMALKSACVAGLGFEVLAGVWDMIEDSRAD